MTRFTRVATASLLAGLGTAGTVAAQPMHDRMGPMRDSMGAPHGGIDFETIDADGDGLATRAELLARATERLARADANGDGGLDREEIVAAMPGPRGGMLFVFAPDPSEHMADRLLAMMGGTESGRIEVVALAERRTNDLLAWADEDRDGALSPDEAEAGREHHGPRGGDRRGRGRDGGGDRD
jgi:hypothetical protein